MLRTLQFSRNIKNIAMIYTKMPRKLFDIVQWCANNNQQYDANVQYVKLVTGGNDPKMTKAMRYAQYVRNAKPHSNTIN